MSNTINGNIERHLAVKDTNKTSIGKENYSKDITPAETGLKRITGDGAILSSSIKAEMEKVNFDPAKVEIIKESIRNGNYPIDLEKVTDNFINIEMYL